MSLLNFFEVRIENTNACFYKCKMCPREKLNRKIGVMSKDDFIVIMKRLKDFNGSFHLHGFGEPLLDRGLIEKVKIAKKFHPKSSVGLISTLGVKVEKEYFQKLILAGLDAIIISIYGFSDKTYKKIHNFDGFSLAKKNMTFLSNAMKKLKKGSCEITIKIPDFLSSQVALEESIEGIETFLSWSENLNFNIRPRSYVHNYGNGRSYNPSQTDKICPVVEGKRGQILNIDKDLNVIPCCYDFNSTIKFGNLKKQTLQEIFSSEEYFNFILAHQTDNLSSYVVCQNCEKLDY
ncbi:MAG: SPASM domain-containing protein [Parachlamydiales bacterium]|nr:SPASM domain-containing protein [Parachlamydiales bacterium]